MPSRRRQPSGPKPAPRADDRAPKGTPVDPMDAAARFAAALKESEAKDKAARERERVAKAEADRTAAAARAAADALAGARRDLDRAIAAVRAAKQAGTGTVAADAQWKAAKARVIELETGSRPAWAPVEPAAEAPEPGESSDAEGATGSGPAEDVGGSDAAPEG